MATSPTGQLPLGRTLVLVAHADDDAVGCGALLQRMREPLVVLATDGAPFDPYFWRAHGSREALAVIRSREAKAAAAALGIRSPLYLWGEDVPFVDQELFRHLPRAWEHLDALIQRERPQALLTSAYEGGHPDHDACAFLSYVADREWKLPVWEVPLYHRSLDGIGVRQEFMAPNGSEVALEPSSKELERKRRAWLAYESQRDTVEHFDPRIERFRPQAAYDFTLPPHSGVLNYESWQWRMTGAEVATEFARFLQAHAAARELAS